ncbi:MAG TPA: hypothetical protein VHZ51_08990 [Ktedonobacteraceae bacterium]|nr:hypothetical protein [Ktedonobacteraceae bacterium]
MIMRIRRFFIEEYQVLRYLELPLEAAEQNAPGVPATYALDLIVGVNGTGKSTLLRLLAEVFQYLRNRHLPPFHFSITYQLYQSIGDPQTVTISNLDEDKQKQLAGGREVAQEKRLYLGVEERASAQPTEELVEAIDERYLPNYVIALTSGSEAGWELAEAGMVYDSSAQNASFPHKDQADVEERLRSWYHHEQSMPPSSVTSSIRGQRTAMSEQRTFYLMKKQQMPLIILCGLLVDMQSENQKQVLPEVLREVKIKTLVSFSLRLHINENAIAADDLSIIEQLRGQATRIVKQGDSQLLIFQVYDQEQISEKIHTLVQEAGNGLELFKQLDQLTRIREDQQRTLQEVNLFFTREYTPPEQEGLETVQDGAPPKQPLLHLLEWFSDGEASFLGRFCLFALLRGTEALVLLDEPEVHFNDYWKRQLVHKLDQALRGQYSHVLMTTHSSITISDVYNTSVWVMKRHNDFTDYVAPPNLRTLGTDPSDIIVHVFGAESATGAQSIAYLQRRVNEILALEDTDEKRKELDTLMGYVGPGPWRFLIRRKLYGLEDNQSETPTSNAGR